MGCFPDGAAVCGALDLVGNVMEWMATNSDTLQVMEPEKDFTPDGTAALSWTYFGDGKEQLCCGSRNWNDPYIRSDSRSFRVVQSLALVNKASEC